MCRIPDSDLTDASDSAALPPGAATEVSANVTLDRGNTAAEVGEEDMIELPGELQIWA